MGHNDIRLNNTGDMKQPGGAPELVILALNLTSCILEYCDLWVKKLKIHFKGVLPLGRSQVVTLATLIGQ
ncbi:hypothetical protein SK128_005174, partial [Halocaridina rubra]